MDTFIQFPVTTNAPRQKTDIPNERRIYSDSLTETLKGFNILKLQETISDSAYDHSDKNDARSDPKINQVVATHTSDGKKRKVIATDTTKGNSPHKLLTNQKISVIIPDVILTDNQTTADWVARSGMDFYAVRAVLNKQIITGTVRSTVGVLKDPLVVNWKALGGTIPQDNNTVVIPPQSHYPGFDWYCTLFPLNQHREPGY